MLVNPWRQGRSCVVHPSEYVSLPLCKRQYSPSARPTAALRERSVILRSAVGIMCVLFFCMHARADYIILPLWDDQDSATVSLGETFDLDIVLDSDASDEHISAIFQVVFSSPGLSYQSYEWYAPYENETDDDDSTPLWTALTTLLTADLFSGPLDVVDVELSNATDGGGGGPSPFGIGKLVTLELLVPADYTGPETVTISAVSDQFFAGVQGGSLVYVDADSGPSFELTIIPEPASVAMLIVPLAILVRRRQSR